MAAISKRLLPLAILLACAAHPGRVAAQAEAPRPAPPGYTEALQLLAAGDTATAIERLWDATREAPRFGPAFVHLGALLFARARHSAAGPDELREARRLLDRGVQLSDDEPELLLEYGLLLGNKRLLDRAREAAERKGTGLPPDAAAKMHYLLGRIDEGEWRTRERRMSSSPSLSMLDCPGLDGPVTSIAVAAAVCPEQAAAWVEHERSRWGFGPELRERMLDHYRQALVLDPAHLEAGLRLLGHLADERDWDEYARIVHRLALVLPDEPRVHLFLGLGLHERGRSADADTAFQRAFALMPAEERRVFEDVSLLLPERTRDRYEEQDSAERAETARLLFAGKDPILLTDVEERRIEHWARLAWVDLWFGNPRTGRRGWETEAGRLWVRYAMPAAAAQAVYRKMTDHPRVSPIDVFGYPSHFWLNGTLRQDLDARMPELYAPRTVTRVVELPVQVVRFRGDAPGLTRVEIFAGMPLDSLGPAGPPVESGVFLFDDRLRPLWEKRSTMESGRGAPVVTYRVPLPPGTYHTAVEARLAGPDSVARPLARYRGEVTTVGFTPGELAVSDILLATEVEPLVPEPRTRDDLRVAPNPAMTFTPDQDIGLYFELYNLLPDAEHFASYELELVVTVVEIEREGPSLALLLAELADKWGLTQEGADAVQLRFRKEASVLARDMIPEFFRIQIPGTPDGRYGLRLTVRDRNTGGTVVTTREFRIRTPRPEPADTVSARR